MPATDRSRDPDRDSMMSFGDHLDELRRRAILALAAPLPLAILAFFFADKLRDVLAAPLRTALRNNGQAESLQSLGVTETMGIDIKLSIVVAVVISAPWIVWQLWKFVEPGLYENERRFARFLVPGSMVLVISGVATLYFILLPLMLEVLVQYGLQPRGDPPPALVETMPEGGVRIPVVTESPKEAVEGQVWLKLPERMLSFAVREADGKLGILSVPVSKDSAILQQYRLSEYIDFVLLLMLGIAIVFQMPLVILLLGWVGILRVETLRQKRRLAFFILTIVAAAVTPTSDMMSMLLMLGPLYMLYELGILLLVAAPPSAVSEGTMVSGFLRRVRSGKGLRRPAQTERPATPAQHAKPAPESRREPPDDPNAGGASA
ncbi:MAG: twin-arginine translocase subunit TatC [Phycisphaerales bacterium]